METKTKKMILFFKIKFGQEEISFGEFKRRTVLVVGTKKERRQKSKMWKVKKSENFKRANPERH